MRKVSLKNVTILELLVAINRRYSDIIALQTKRGDKFQGISYIELGRRTSDTAYSLKKLGVERADRVAILSESRPEWAIAFFGIVSCAGITVPLDIKLSDAEIEFILNDSEAKCIFVSEKFLERIINLKPKLMHLKSIISFDEVSKEGILLLKDFKVPENEIAHRDIQPDDVGIIVYTSGTTGVAKGVELTYKNLLFEVMCLHQLITFSPKDEFVSILPLNHMLEITGGFLGPLYAGATVTYCESLKPTNILSLMNETKTTVMICVPLILKMFHNGIMRKIEDLPKFKRKLTKTMLHFSRFLLKLHIRVGKILFASVHKQFGGRIRCFVSGGAPLDPVVELDFNAMGFRILQGYGLTETSPVITVNNFAECKYGSVGKPLPEVEIKILTNSETGTKDGEIVTRGPHVMKGYYRNPEKTQEVLRESWFHTGDIGYLDKDGFLFISGRIKNLIVLGAGKKVFPEEVEEVMSHSPYIKEICVLGRVATKGMRKGTEEVYAVVVPNFDQFELDKRKDELVIREKIASEINRLSENLAEYKRIMDFEIWKDELPKTSTRKIKRKVLIEIINEKAKSQKVEEKVNFVETTELKEDEFTTSLKEVLADTAKVETSVIKPYSNLYNELGIDSLMKVELLCAVERRLAIKIPDEIAYEVNTFADLVRFAKEYKQGRADDVTIKDQDIIPILKKNILINLTRGLSYFTLKVFAKIYFKLEIKGIENIPKDKSFIIAANHTSHLDFPIIFTSLPYSKMKDVIAPAAQDYFYTNPLRRRIIECAFNTFAFERIGNFVHSLRICSEIIKRDKSIILFPEGTRSTEGKIQPFKPGIGSLAYDLDRPIVPTYIKGAFEALPKGKTFPYPRKIRVYFGKAIYPKQLELSRFASNYEKYSYLSELTFNEVKRLQADKND